ncbi:MAG: proprotein convertase P-domain-containing protein [Deltaproteobacteria bacterium]|nr:proprotein convertase P-domain-containing protein [Deltaproteobacteria bacterium]
MMQQLAADGRLDRADVDKLVDATMQDKVLSLGEKAELAALIAQFSDKFDCVETRQRLEAFLGLGDGEVRALAHQLERDDGVIDGSDADQLAALVDRDGRFKSEARFSLRGLMIGAKMTDEARSKIGAVAARADEAPPVLVERTSTPALAIPDNKPAGVTDSLRFDEPGAVGDVRVELDLEHTYRGDLRVSLIAPDGTEVTLHDKRGGSAEDLIGVYPIDLAPAQSLDAFKGMPIAGEWKLKLVDTAGVDVGTLNGWRLAFAPAAAPPPGGDAIELGKTAAERPVFLSRDGFFVEDKATTKPAGNAELGSGLFRMAELVDDKRGNPLADAGLALATRQRVLQNLRDALGLVPAGGAAPSDLKPMQALQLRASALTVLLALCESAGKSGDELALKQQAFDAYTKALRAETNPVLRDSLIFNLHAIASRLTPDMRRVSNELTNEIAPLSPPYDDWFKDGNHTLNVFWASGQGSEGFYAGTCEMLKAEGFVAEGTERSSGPNVYTKTFTNRHGQDLKVRITTHVNRDDIFAKMSDPSFHIVGYDGHSDIGRAIPSALRNAPDGVGKKLIFYGLCAGKDNLHRVRERYPDAQVLTTFTSSYFGTEKLPDGSRRMSESENFNTLLELIDGAVERYPWTTINANIRDNAVMYPHSHVMPGGTNYLSPVHTMLRRRVLDSDHDGQADCLDRLCSFDTFKVDEDTRREFTPIDPGRPAAALDGSRVHLAAMALNTATGYNTVTQAWKKGNIIGSGYFEPKPGEKAIVKFERDTVDGQPVLHLRVNSRYAHMSTESLRAVAHYQFILDSGRGGNPADPVDRKLMALTFACFSILYDESMWGRDDKIWKGLLAANRLPDDLPFAPLAALVEPEEHDYSGNMTHVRKWKESIPAAALEALKRADVGVP